MNTKYNNIKVNDNTIKNEIETLSFEGGIFSAKKDEYIKG